MATLKENQTSDITMSIGIDGDSMGNNYQNTAGELQFKFSVQYDDPVVQEPTIVEKVVKLPGKVIEGVKNRGTGKCNASCNCIDNFCRSYYRIYRYAKRNKQRKENRHEENLTIYSGFCLDV